MFSAGSTERRLHGEGSSSLLLKVEENLHDAWEHGAKSRASMTTLYTPASDFQRKVEQGLSVNPQADFRDAH